MFFTNDFEIARTILLVLVRVYEGYKIKKDILHPFIPHTSFLELYKIGKWDAKILGKHVLVLKGLKGGVHWRRVVVSINTKISRHIYNSLLRHY